MICKAIVDEVISPFQVRVRIPIYHKIESSPYATPRSNLPIASVCVLPGAEVAFKRGDVVFVGFELDELDNPIILGVLSRENVPSSSNIKALSLKVDVNCDLPDVDKQKQINAENALDTTLESPGGGVAKFG